MRVKIIRKLHLWLGLLFAPSIIFFALSGALQILGLHEGRDASPVIAKLAQIHKDQTVEDRSAAPRPAAKPVDATPKPVVEKVAPHRSQLLVVWFLLMAVGLLTSTGLGIYMAFAYKRDRVVILALLGAGIAVPVVGLFV